MPTRLTAVYWDWIDSIEDAVTKARIHARVDRLSDGKPGRYRRLPGGICEMKLNFGPGYRVYYAVRNGELIVPSGGDKSSQARDIRAALVLLERL
jgi:putative addiction module killer protein